MDNHICPKCKHPEVKNIGKFLLECVKCRYRWWNKENVQKVFNDIC